MPIHVQGYTKHRWRETPDGLPIAEVTTLGGILYVLTCPLCGCMHEISSTGVIEPRCLLREYAAMRWTHGQATNWKYAYAEWLKLNPKAADQQRVYAADAAMLQALPKPKQTRKAKAA